MRAPKRQPSNKDIAYYIIQHNETGLQMPEVHTGYTHWYPIWNKPNRSAETPRLFSTEKQALNALKSYCLGEFKRTENTEKSYYFFLKRARINPRNIKDFTIIKVHLNLIEKVESK